MTSMPKSHKFTLGNCPLIFSTMVILAVLLIPLLSALPAYADWGADVRLTNDGAKSTWPSMTVSGNNVHVAWQDNRDGNAEIYYKRSTDGGATWSADTRLTNDTAYSTGPSVAVSGNNVHIAWYDNRNGNWEIYYKRSTDGGSTWGADTRLTNTTVSCFSPSAAVSGNNVYIAWYDDRNGNAEIYYKRSNDGGATWGVDTRLTNDTANSIVPSMAVSGNNVHVAWQDNRDGNDEIYYKRSTDGGATWSADTRLTNYAGFSLFPSLSVSGNNVHIAWHDDRDNDSEIYYKRSTDGGTTWGADTRLSNSPLLTASTSVSASGNNVFVAWNDDRDGADEFRIYYKHSTNGGTTWGTETRLSDDEGMSLIPIVAVSCNNIRIVWEDSRNGNSEIYYKKYSGNPAITSVNPKQGIQGETHSFTINGANFTGATGVSFGDGITVNSFNVDSDSKISVNITISPAATLGIRNLSVTTCQGTATHDFWVGLNPTTQPHGATTPATPQGPVGLSAISVKSASLSASKVAPGMPVTVTANVANTGTINGNASIKVYVNGELENSQGITVNSGSDSQLTFNISRNEPGTYTVYVGGADAGSFTVDEFAGPGPIIIGAGLLFLILFVAIIILFRRKSQLGR